MKGDLTEGLFIPCEDEDSSYDERCPAQHAHRP